MSFHWYSEQGWGLWKLPVLRRQLQGDSGSQCGTHSWDLTPSPPTPPKKRLVSEYLRFRTHSLRLHDRNLRYTHIQVFLRVLFALPCPAVFNVQSTQRSTHDCLQGSSSPRLTPLCSPGTACCWLGDPRGFACWPFIEFLLLVGNDNYVLSLQILL